MPTENPPNRGLHGLARHRPPTLLALERCEASANDWPTFCRDNYQVLLWAGIVIFAACSGSVPPSLLPIGFVVLILVVMESFERRAQRRLGLVIAALREIHDQCRITDEVCD